MKHATNLFFALALAAIAFAILNNPPGGDHWIIFVTDPSAGTAKLIFLAETYLWPATLSFTAIVLFQLQFRIAGSGVSARTIFAVCVFASGTMLLGLRAISSSPHSGPSYVSGMALAYTVMSRLYAVRLRTLWNLRIPWPIWRADQIAVQEIDRLARARLEQMSTARSR